MLAVRAEIKLWEKAFRASNGRNPTVDDIRALPTIADKYRLYKRLSKQALPDTSRPVHSTAPLAACNPFSPAKNKGKNKAEPPAARNPFSTPTKSARGQSLLDSPTELSAVSRARKRLRGEPVSPTPNKEKRQRTSSYPKLPMPALDDDSTTTSLHKSGSTVIGESPVKQSAGNKFTVLFEETLPPLVLEYRKETDATPQASLANPPTDQSEFALPVFDGGLGWLKNTHALHSKANYRSRVSKSRTAQEADTPRAENGHDSFKPTKRSLLEMESIISSSPGDLPTLIPPSPPPETGPSAVRTSKKSKTSRKKAKMSDSNPGGVESSEESGGDLEPKIKVVNAMACRTRQGHRGDNEWDEILELDPDPILIHAFRPNPPSPRGIHSPRQGSPAHINISESDHKFELDLPDQFRDMLAVDVVDMEDSPLRS
ncbi:hypothetical protein APHAL10511_006072 [Amanita phalloides]|nr:hypothetical protein APHAL10511_006072 [Amanita phalloides]